MEGSVWTALLMLAIMFAVDVWYVFAVALCGGITLIWQEYYWSGGITSLICLVVLIVKFLNYDRSTGD